MTPSESADKEVWSVERLLTENQALRERLERREQELLASNRMMADVLNQNVARLETLELRTRQLEAICTVGYTLAQAGDLQQVMEMALEQALGVLGQSGASIYLVEGGGLVLQAHRGFTPEMVAQLGRLELGQGLAGMVAQDGEPRVADDLTTYQELRLPMIGHHFRSAAVVPLEWAGQVIGTIAVGSSTAGALTREDVDFLTALGASIAFYIVNARQKARLEERVEELALLTELSSIIASSPSIELVYESFVRSLKRVADIARAALVLVEGDHLRIAVLYSEVEAHLGRLDIVPVKGSPGERLVAAGQTLYQPNLTHERQFWADERLLSAGLRCNIRIPLMHQARFIGYVTLSSKLPHAYDDPRPRWLLEEAVGLLAPAVAHQELLKQLRGPGEGHGTPQGKEPGSLSGGQG